MTATNIEIGAYTRQFAEALQRNLQGNTRRQHALLALTDCGAVVTVGTLAWLARYGWHEQAEVVPLWLLVLFPLAWLLSLVSFGAYSLPYLQNGVDEFRRVATASLTLAGGIGIACYFFDIALSRVFFLVLFGAGLPALLLVRLIRRRVFHRLRRIGALAVPVVVAGSPIHVDAVTRVLRREKWLGYRVVGALTGDESRQTPEGLAVLGTVDQVATFARDLDLQAVIFAEGSFHDAQQFTRIAWELERHSTRIIVVPALNDIAAGRLAARPVGGLPLVHVARPQAVAASRWGKRAFDIVGSMLLILMAAPVVAVAAIAIKLEDRGPVFFKQRRVGRWGEEFECYKMRSMVVDAEARKAELQSRNEGAGVLFKIAHDPRITKVGRFIRRYSIDELPQFLNVLQGDMSLVGPRPALPSEVARYDRDAVRRLDVRPGLTGLWQVSGRSDLSWEETVRLDVYYVDNWSMMQDVLIIARTAKAVLGSAGAY